QLPHRAIKERARRLRQCGASALARHLDGEVGAVRRVLVEDGGTGHTEHFTKVALARPTASGRLIDLRIAGHDGRQLLAA
ncbi:MAG: tRNA (N(6)-L-threonylcarbamoyladenosine(37)-C(2))-methylthiotransferase MtaB, partial [Xanthobacteraceae bacterium]